MRHAEFTAVGRSPLSLSLFDYAGLSRAQFVVGIEWLPEDLSARKGRLTRHQRLALRDLCRRVITESVPEVDPGVARQLDQWLRRARFVRLQIRH